LFLPSPEENVRAIVDAGGLSFVMKLLVDDSNIARLRGAVETVANISNSDADAGLKTLAFVFTFVLTD
jgi:hypothetical protein